MFDFLVGRKSLSSNQQHVIDSLNLQVLTSWGQSTLNEQNCIQLSSKFI